MLRRDGYAGLTTGNVAREAGTSIGTVYRYFTDREDIFAALAHENAVALAKSFEISFALRPPALSEFSDRIVTVIEERFREDSSMCSVGIGSRTTPDQADTAWADIADVAVGRLVTLGRNQDQAREVIEITCALVDAMLAATELTVPDHRARAMSLLRRAASSILSEAADSGP